MVNESKSLINAVIGNKPKMLTGLNQKVSGQVQWLQIPLTKISVPPAERRHLTYSGIYAERGKPVILLARGKQVVRRADRVAGLG